MEDFRIERDSMGEVQVPANVYWGAQTQRAVENFSISPLRISKPMLKAIVLIKKHAAIANAALGKLDSKIANAIVQAADEILNGGLQDQFPIDVFQTGSGTSWNMNVNEVLANRANVILGGKLGDHGLVHPNDHVNKGQSSNDVIPAAINIASRMEIVSLVEAMDHLVQVIENKEAEFKDVLKLGRTHLQDAVPMRLSDEFSAWRQQIQNGIKRILKTYPAIEELAIGGTAVGSALNCTPGFAERTIEGIFAETRIHFVQADNLFEAIATRDSSMELMNALHSVAVSLMKIGQDLRILSSGPRSGIGEINLPSLQPGSSIMPGKVNPVIAEMTIQTAAYVMGKHTSVTIACQNSPLQLNIMMPLISNEIVSSIEILRECIMALADRCFAGITANKEECLDKIDWSLAVVTPLAIKIGYDKAAEIAYYAYKNKIKVRDAAVQLSNLTKEEVDEILDITKMV